MKGCQLEICNWEEWQGRAVKFDWTTWLRLSNELPENELWDLLTLHEFKAFIYLLCHFSKKAHKSGIKTIYFRNLERHSRIPSEVFASTVKKLKTLEVVTYREIEVPDNEDDLHVTSTRLGRDLGESSGVPGANSAGALTSTKTKTYTENSPARETKGPEPGRKPLSVCFPTLDANGKTVCRSHHFDEPCPVREGRDPTLAPPSNVVAFTGGGG